MAYTTINKSTEHFNTLTWTGNGNATRSYTGVGFQPDLLWTKNRSASQNYMFTDAIRGISNIIQSSTSSATISNPSSGYLSSFDSDGFSVQAGSSSTANFNTNSQNYVAWNWKAGGTTPTKTYKVVVVGGKYRFRNSADSATFAEDHPTLDLQEGGTYTFDLSDSTLSSHPFKFSTTSNGTHGGGSEYTSGVATNLAPGNPGATAILTLSASTPTLYYYCSSHSGMGGQINTNSLFGSSNFDGSIQSTISVNTTAGFSVVKWTGNGSGSTIGHGLDVKPKIIFVKNISSTRNWVVNVGEMVGADERSLYLNVNDAIKNDAAADHGYTYNNTTTTFQTAGGSGGTQDDVNKNGDTIIAYCFGEKTGYSKFGKYTANASTDGPFLYCGFKPKFLMVKRTSQAAPWSIIDAGRNTYNPANLELQADANSAEANQGDGCDFLSNGVKLRDSADMNSGSGDAFIFMAFGQSLVGSNNVPATAR